MKIEIEITEIELLDGNSKGYCASININGEFYDQIAPQSTYLKDLLPSIVHCLESDPGFYFKEIKS